MSTKNFVPRVDNEGQLGTTSKRWADTKTVLVNGYTPADLSSAQTLSNKSVNDTCKIVDDSDATKVLQPSLGGMTTGVTLTLAPLQSTSKTLNIPDITATDTLAMTTLAQTLSNQVVNFAAVTTTVAPRTDVAGTVLTAAAVGAHEFDGAAYYKTIDVTSGRGQDFATQIFRLTSDGGAIGAGIADYFGANSAFPTVLNGVYLLEFHCYFLKSTAGTVTWTLTHTQTLTNLNAFWIGNVITGFGATGAVSGAGVDKQTSAATALPVTGSLTTAVDHYYKITAVVQCATAGNIRLRATESAGTITPRQGSYYTATRLSGGNVGTFVA